MCESVNNNEDNFVNKNYEIKFPFTIKPVDPETNSELLKDFTGEKDGYVFVGPKKYFLPATYLKHAEHFYNFQAREDDIWIVTHPRSGTTWTQELVWLIANDLDYATAQRELLTKRFPYFDFCVFVHEQMEKQLIAEQEGNKINENIVKEICVPCYESLPNIKTRRFIKTHFPLSLLPPSVQEKQAKIIYVARHPKDVVVSYYHLLRLYRNIGYVGNFPKFWNYFERNLLLWSPYYEHVKEGWEQRFTPNVLFMFYEDMSKNLPETIQKVANFLDKPMTNKQIVRLADHLSIENFRKNPSVNQHELREVKILSSNEEPFVRNGKTTVKGWQKEYTPDVVERVEAWIEKNLRNSTICFPQN